MVVDNGKNHQMLWVQRFRFDWTDGGWIVSCTTDAGLDTDLGSHFRVEVVAKVDCSRCMTDLYTDREGQKGFEDLDIEYSELAGNVTCTLEDEVVVQVVAEKEV